MKGLKITLIAILGGLILILAAGMFLVMSGRLNWGRSNGGSGRFDFTSWGSSILCRTQEFDVGDVTNIMVAGRDSMIDIVIKPGDGDKIKMEEYFTHELSENELASVSLEQGELKIITKNIRNMNAFGNFYGSVELYLPVKLIEQLKNLQVNTASGDIVLGEFGESGGELQLDHAIFESTSGDIQADYLNAKVIQAESTSGSIIFKNIMGKTEIASTSGDIVVGKVIGETKIASTSGEQTVKEIEGGLSMKSNSGDQVVAAVQGPLDCETTSGNINVRQLKGMGDFSASSGNITVEAALLDKSLKMSASSGNITLTVPSDSGIDLEIETTSGNIRTDFDKDLSYNEDRNHASGQIGNADTTIRIRAASGNVSLQDF